MNPPTCQIVVPSFRDSVRLRPFLLELVARLPPVFSIQVVDDGSGALEAEAIRALVERARETYEPGGPQLCEPLLLSKNCGKGAAVRAGWLAGDGFDLAGFVDADGSVSADEILRGYEFLRAQSDALDGILGSRLKVLGRRVERKLFRHLCGRAFATAVSEFSGLPVYDTQCGFKLFKTSALLPVLPRLQSDRFAFDVELIIELTMAGAKLQEFPVDWTHRSGSKVSVPRDMLPMLWDVWRTSRRARRSPREG
ncbi:MAG: glycosyltransferase [Terrimicrobiaceae bacterium]|nr:glycosyltransferase [Terrimicrobiaceae bacterium]